MNVEHEVELLKGEIQRLGADSKSGFFFTSVMSLCERWAESQTFFLSSSRNSWRLMPKLKKITDRKMIIYAIIY